MIPGKQRAEYSFLCRVFFSCALRVRAPAAMPGPWFQALCEWSFFLCSWVSFLVHTWLLPMRAWLFLMRVWPFLMLPSSFSIRPPSPSPASPVPTSSHPPLLPPPPPPLPNVHVLDLTLEGAGSPTARLSQSFADQGLHSGQEPSGTLGSI